MANQELVKRLLVEIDGNVEKLRRELRKGEADVQAFAGKARTAGQTAGRAADVVANKQANAARAVASATETIARQGKVSGEASKQIIAQASNAALFWGPKGAVVGAIGISVLAIVGMFTRVKREAAEAAKATRDEFAKISTLDLMGTARRLRELNEGDLVLRGDLGSTDAATREEARNRLRDDFGSVGISGLEEERRRLTAEMAELAAQIDTERLRAMQLGLRPSELVGGLSSRYTQMREDLESINVLLPEIAKREAFTSRELARKSAEEGERTKDRFGIEQDAAAQKEADKAVDEARANAERAKEKAAEDLQAFAKDLEALALRELASVAEQVAAEFNEKIAAGLKRGATPEQIARLEAMRDSAVSLAVSIAEVDVLLQKLDIAAAIGVEPTVESFVELTAVAKDLRDQLESAIPGTARYLGILAEIEKVERRRSEMAKSVATAGPGRADPSGVRAAADYAREIQQAADGALQLAQNLGGASENAVDLLRAVGQIAGNLPALQEAIKAGSGLGIVGAALPILGALSSLVGPSPADLQRRQELRENTEALRKLTEQAGLLGSVNVTGSAASNAAADLRRFLTSDTVFPFNARKGAERFGLNLSELDAIAASYGITLNKTRESFIQLAEAIGGTITKLGEFGTDLDSQRRQAEAEIDILGITDPAEQFRIRSRATAGRSPALDAVLAGLDPNSTESRETARQRARDLFEIMRAGGGRLGAGQLGDLAGDELLQALLDLIAGLDAIDDAVGVATGSSLGTVSGFRGLTEATGSRLEEHQRALVGYARQAQGTRLEMLAALQRVAGLPLTVPALPSGFSGSRTSGAGGVVIQFAEGAVQVQVSVAGASADPREIGAAVQEGVTLGLEEAIYAAVKTAQVVAGDLRIAR